MLIAGEISRSFPETIFGRDREHALPVLGSRFSRTEHERGCIVDQGINRAKTCCRIRDARPHLLLIRYVRMHEDALVHAIRDSLPARGIDIEQGDSSSLARQTLAVARPMPEAAPVTSAILFLKRCVIEEEYLPENSTKASWTGSARVYRHCPCLRAMSRRTK